MAAGSLLLKHSCLNGSLLSSLTCLKLGCGQMGTCAHVHAETHTHTHTELRSAGDQTSVLYHQVKVPARRAADSPQEWDMAGTSRGEPVSTVSPSPCRGCGSPMPTWFWPCQDRPSASPTHKAALHPSSASGAISGLISGCPGPGQCVQTSGPTQARRGSRPVPGRGPGGCS